MSQKFDYARMERKWKISQENPGISKRAIILYRFGDQVFKKIDGEYVDVTEAEIAKDSVEKKNPSAKLSPDGWPFSIVWKAATGYWKTERNKLGEEFQKRIFPDIDYALTCTEYFRSVGWLK